MMGADERRCDGPQLIDVMPLQAGLAFGARVAGLTRRSLRDADIRKRLYDLWIDRGVLVFADFDGLDAQIELSRCFGTLVAHPAVEARAERPELTDVRYQPDTGWLIDVDGDRRGNWLPWHSDMIYVDRINRGGVLRPVRLPHSLGSTAFIDKIAAYSSLPESLRRRIDGLEVVYAYDLDPAHQKFGRTAQAHTIRMSNGVASIQARLGDFPRVIHPMIYTQAETGRKVLNVSPWFAVGINDMFNDEGDVLLEEVAQHIVRTQSSYVHLWRMNEMVLWDNWRVLHSAEGCPADEERWLQRTTIEGDYGLGRSECGTTQPRDRYISV